MCGSTDEHAAPGRLGSRAEHMTQEKREQEGNINKKIEAEFHNLLARLADVCWPKHGQDTTR